MQIWGFRHSNATPTYKLDINELAYVDTRYCHFSGGARGVIVRNNINGQILYNNYISCTSTIAIYAIPNAVIDARSNLILKEGAQGGDGVYATRLSVVAMTSTATSKNYIANWGDGIYASILSTCTSGTDQNFAGNSNNTSADAATYGLIT